MAKRLFGRKAAWRTPVAGLLSGLAGTLVMGQFQNGWAKAKARLESSWNPEEDSNGKGAGESGQDENATMKAAGKLANLVGSELSYEGKKKAGPFIHYGFGTVMGAIYGVAKENGPLALQKMHPAVSGARFGSALYLAADELAVPALGLSPKASESPVSAHLYGLASHLVYGLSVGSTYYLARKIF